MKTLMLAVCTIVALGAGTGTVRAANPMEGKEATPTLKERITKDTIKGTLIRTDGEYYWVRDTDGKEVKLHVDGSTKLDKVIPGDRVKAYITDSGHTTTLQRDE
jgi:hypothetical protein